MESEAVTIPAATLFITCYVIIIANAETAARRIFDGA